MRCSVLSLSPDRKLYPSGCCSLVKVKVNKFKDLALPFLIQLESWLPEALLSNRSPDASVSFFFIDFLYFFRNQLTIAVFKFAAIIETLGAWGTMKRAEFEFAGDKRCAYLNRLLGRIQNTRAILFQAWLGLSWCLEAPSVELARAEANLTFCSIRSLGWND